MIDKKAFGRALRKHRRESGKTLEQLLTTIGWSKSYLMDLENGRSAPPKIDKVKRLCAALNLDTYRRYSFVLEAVKSCDTICFPIEVKIEQDVSSENTQDSPSKGNQEARQAVLAKLLYFWNDLTDKQLETISKAVADIGSGHY